jgi:hypothetical protein
VIVETSPAVLSIEDEPRLAALGLFDTPASFDPRHVHLETIIKGSGAYIDWAEETG